MHFVIHVQSQRQLAELILADRAAGVSRRLDGGDQKRREDANNRDRDQQFDERETRLTNAPDRHDRPLKSV